MAYTIDTITERKTNDSGSITEQSEQSENDTAPANDTAGGELQQRLLAGLAILPSDISLCLIGQNKRPHGANWQKEPLSISQVYDAIVNGITLTNSKGNEYFLPPDRILGYGIVTGTPLTVNGERYYVMALDQDGLSAIAKLNELTNGDSLPKTVTFTSQREGRCQRLFLIPAEYEEHIQTRKFSTAAGEELAFRWRGLQSVLPPSVHPTTNGYIYENGCAFNECPIAIAPDWMIELMLSDHSEPSEPNQVEPNENENDTCTSPRTATTNDSDANCLDFRDVGHLIPTWNDSARSGWAAFQCPVHTKDGGVHSTDHIHVNNSSGKWEAHCGCDRKEIYKEVCRIVGFEPPKPERMPIFVMANDGTLYPAEFQDKEAAMAYLAKPGNEAKVREKISARYGKNNNGNGNGNGNDSTNNGNGSGGKKRNGAGSGKPPNVNVYAQHMKDQYGTQYRYCDEENQWYAWTGKKWEQYSDNLIDARILEHVEAEGFIELTANYIDNIRKYMKRKLLVKKWEEWDRSKYVAFSNGILEIDSGKLIPHTHESGFTSFLPFDYSLLLFTAESPIESLKINCPHVYDFFNRAMRGQPKRILKLLATINATIKHRFHDLQLFTHIQGDPGTGKNTFTNLLGKIVGDENRLHTNPKALEKPDELASVVGKQLVVCPDVRKQVENVQAFLNLTGGTPIHYRKLFKDRGEKKFYGHLVVVSNTPIFTGDTTGIDRRLNLIEFENPIPTEQRDGAAEAIYDAELPSLIQVALSLTDKAVSDLLKGIGAGEIPEYRQLAWETRIGEDSMAAWANEHLIRDANGMIPVGDANRTAEGEYKTLTAYGSYLAFCDADGNKFRVTRETFCKRLQNMIQQAIGWKEVKKRKAVNVHVYAGVRIRNHSDNAIPFISDLLCQEAASRSIDLPASYWVASKLPGSPTVDGVSVSPAKDFLASKLPGSPTVDGVSVSPAKDFLASKLPGSPTVDGVSVSPANPANFSKNSESQKSIFSDPLSNQPRVSVSDNNIEVGKPDFVADLLANPAQGADDSDFELAGRNEALLAKRPPDAASELAGRHEALLADESPVWAKQLVLEVLNAANFMRCCSVPTEVAALKASINPAIIDAAKELLSSDEREQFERLETEPNLTYQVGDRVEIEEGRSIMTGTILENLPTDILYTNGYRVYRVDVDGIEIRYYADINLRKLKS